MILESQGGTVIELDRILSTGSRHRTGDAILVRIKDFQESVVIAGRMLDGHRDTIIRSIVRTGDDGGLFQQGSELVTIDDPVDADRHGMVAVGVVGHNLENDRTLGKALDRSLKRLGRIPVQSLGARTVVPGYGRTLDARVIGRGPGQAGPVRAGGNHDILDFSEIDDRTFFLELAIDGVLPFARGEEAGTQGQTR